MKTKARLQCCVPPLLWRHNGRDSVSNHQPYDCLINRFFRRRSEKTSKLRVTGLCAGNSPGTGEFPTQMASNAENVSIWWRHHGWTFVLTIFMHILNSIHLSTVDPVMSCVFILHGFPGVYLKWPFFSGEYEQTYFIFMMLLTNWFYNSESSTGGKLISPGNCVTEASQITITEWVAMKFCFCIYRTQTWSSLYLQMP